MYFPASVLYEQNGVINDRHTLLLQTRFMTTHSTVSPTGTTVNVCRDTSASLFPSCQTKIRCFFCSIFASWIIDLKTIKVKPSWICTLAKSSLEIKWDGKSCGCIEIRVVCSDPGVWGLSSEPCRVHHFLLHCKFTLSDHLFSNYILPPLLAETCQLQLHEPALGSVTRGDAWCSQHFHNH